MRILRATSASPSNKYEAIVRIGSVMERPYSRPVSAEIGQATVAIRPIMIPVLVQLQPFW